MIRRNDGNDWLILSQVDHARLAAELAKVWRHCGAADWGISDLLIRTVRRHDDGWRQWETRMEVDPDNGVPRQFTEMPMAVSARIWTVSIEDCAGEHPLSGIWVSRHFCHLAQHALTSHADNRDDVEAAKQFLVDQTQYQRDLQSLALEDVTAREFGSLSEIGYRFLRLFDGLSLWLCCAERTDPFDVRCGGEPARFTPYADRRIVVEPYVLTELPLTLSVPARRIAARSYAGNEDLQASLAAAPVETLCWRFDTADIS